jgi:hypothetical protein
VPPKITAQTVLYPNGSLLAAASRGDAYQWYKNGALISGATLKSLQLTTGSVGAGTYTVKVTNSGGSVTGGTYKYTPGNNPNNHDLVPIPGTNLAFSRYETTVGQWKAFLAETGWNKSDSWRNLLNNRDNKPIVQDDSHPVVSVSYSDASDYCQWLSSKTGLAWRLPTLAEWNSAVGTVTYPWGENYPPTNLDGNYWDNNDSFAGTSPVGYFRPNQLGIYDLGGNAWEWTSSGDSSGIVGGGYDNDTVTQAYCLISASFQNFGSEIRNSAVGFRVVCELPADFSTGLVAYYPFNGNASDATGNGYNGTVVGASLALDRFGKQSCYAFPTAGNKIILPIDHAKFEKSFTLSIWVMANPFNNSYPQIVCGENSYIGIGGNGTAYTLDLINKISFLQYIQSSDSYYGYMNTISPIQTSVWSHIVITGDESNRSIYMNGQLNQSVKISAIPRIIQGDKIALGGHFSIDDEQFRWQGLIDDFRLYNRALTVKDVAALYNSEK